MSCLIIFVCFTACVFFFFKQKTAYEMRISDWSSDVCSSDLVPESIPDRCADRAGDKVVDREMRSLGPLADHLERLPVVLALTGVGIDPRIVRPDLRRDHCPELLRDRHPGLVEHRTRLPGAIDRNGVGEGQRV